MASAEDIIGGVRMSFRFTGEDAAAAGADKVAGRLDRIRGGLNSVTDRVDDMRSRFQLLTGVLGGAFGINVHETISNMVPQTETPNQTAEVLGGLTRLGTEVGGSIGGQLIGSAIGGKIGGTLGSALGPIGSLVGFVAGSLVGEFGKYLLNEAMTPELSEEEIQLIKQGRMVDPRIIDDRFKKLIKEQRDEEEKEEDIDLRFTKEQDVVDQIARIRRERGTRIGIRRNRLVESYLRAMPGVTVDEEAAEQGYTISQFESDSLINKRLEMEKLLNNWNNQQQEIVKKQTSALDDLYGW